MKSLNASKILMGLVIFLFTFSAYALTPKKKKEVKKDTLDSVVKKIQRMVLKSKKVGSKITHYMDYNSNGVADAEITLIGEKIFSEKLDLNNDGKYDKSTWNYESGDILSTETEDRNFDGKVDLKTVRTLKGAKKGFFIQIVYNDKDFDGKFDSKKTSEVEIHQGMGISSVRAGVSASNGDGHCINCDTQEFEDAHLPRILDQEAEFHLESFLMAEGKRGIRDKMKLGGYFKYKVHIQEDCYGPKYEPLFEKEGRGNAAYPKLIKDGLETGLSCMENLALTSRLPSGASQEQKRLEDARVVHSTNNLVKAVGGLIGYGFLQLEPGSDEDYKYDHHHGQKLTFICKSNDVRPPLNWQDNSGNLSAQVGYGAQAQSRTVFGRGTIAKRGGIHNHENKLKSKYSAPNIVFNPQVASLLNNDRSWKKEYNGQGREEKFKELVFHEYLHTALGTMHTADESQVDMAQTCGDFCFSNPAGGDKLGAEIKELSGDVCSGKYFGVGAQYKAKMKRLKCLKRLKDRTPNQLSTELPPVGNGAGQCPSGRPEFS